jgi:hypothetical protein
MPHIAAYGLPAGIGALLIAAAAILRYHHHRTPGTKGKAGEWLRKISLSHRVSMVLFLAGAGFLALGVLPWQNALATLAGTGAGLIVMLAVALFAALGFWLEIRHHHASKRARAHVYAVIAGSSLVMLILNGARLLREAARSPRSTVRALSQSVHRVSSGHAAHSMTTKSALEIVAAVLVALALVLVLVGKHEPKANRKGSGSGNRQQPAITTGQRALPAGKGN